MSYYNQVQIAGSLRGGTAYARLNPSYEQQTPQYPTPNPYQLAVTGYRHNELIYACISKRAGALSEAPLALYDDTNKRSRKPLPAHPLRKLLKRPNPEIGEAEFWSITTISRDVAGFSAWEIERNRMGDPIALWWMRPDWCSFRRGPDLPLAFVRYQPAGLPPVDVARADILLFMDFDPLFPLLKGLSRSAIAMRQYSVDNNATDFLKIFFERGAVYAGGVYRTEQSLSQEEGARYKDEIMAKKGGVSNWADPLVLGQGLDYKSNQMNMKEMAFEAIDGRTETRICQVFDLNPIIVAARVGLARSTENNYQMARDAWYDESISREWHYYAGEISQQLVPQYEGDDSPIYADFDTTEVLALQARRENRRSAAREDAKQNIITRDEARSEGPHDTPIDKGNNVFIGITAKSVDAPAITQRVLDPDWEEEDEPAAPDVVPGTAPAAAPIAVPPPNPFNPSAPAAPAAAAPAQFKAWRRAALAAVGRAVGAPWDGELIECQSGTDTRAVFERHVDFAKGRAEGAKSDTRLLADALEHAARALELAA